MQHKGKRKPIHCISRFLSRAFLGAALLSETLFFPLYYGKAL